MEHPAKPTAARRSWPRGTRLILGDVALVAAFDHLRPRLQAVLREPSYREDQVVVGDGILQPSAAFAERTPGQVVAVAME